MAIQIIILIHIHMCNYLGNSQFETSRNWWGVSFVGGKKSEFIIFLRIDVFLFFSVSEINLGKNLLAFLWSGFFLKILKPALKI
jgi:hypothetical protein